MTVIADYTLDEIRGLLAPAIADAAIFDGWSEAAICAAANAAGVNTDIALLAFPGGAMDMIAAWMAGVDSQMEAALPPEKLADLPIRAKIRDLVQFRLDTIAGHEESLKRALAIMAMPQNIGAALKLGWASADRMWRLAGDIATDYNYYSKRTILAGIYAATLTVFANDDSDDKQETRAFLGRRIDGVMRFEKTKAQMIPSGNTHFSVTRFLGRLRYPAR